jgi:hypothetical protein
LNGASLLASPGWSGVGLEAAMVASSAAFWRKRHERVRRHGVWDRKRWRRAREQEVLRV